MSRKYNAGDAKPEAGPQPIPAGEYHMKIVEAVFGKSKTSGHDMVTVRAVPVDGAYAGRKVRLYVMFPPPGAKTVGQTLHFLKTIGEPYEGEFEWDEANWINKQFMATVGMEMFNGEPQNKISRVKPLPEGVAAVSAPAEEEIPF